MRASSEPQTATLVNANGIFAHRLVLWLGVCSAAAPLAWSTSAAAVAAESVAAAAAVRPDDSAVQRTDCRRVYFPLDPQTAGDAEPAAAWLSRAERAAEAGDERLALTCLLRAHHAHPADPALRRMLAIPSDSAVAVTTRPGRAAPAVLRWPAGSYLQAQTPHFVISSAVDAARTRQVAVELERFYWIWTQIFFPLWEGRSDVIRAIRGGPGIGSGGQPMRVVLFADRQAYVAALQPHVPGIEQSTGFYSDPQRTTFLVDGTTADALATRYHELTHQLMREATGSQLRGRRMPGDAADFWLVEGVASYMESVRLADTYAWVGGWESPRLQFARYRWLVGGDRLRLAEIADQGRLQVQQRSDLARWYAYAAAYTHLLIDGGPAAQGQAVVGRLKQLYAIAPRAIERAVAAPPIDLEAASEAMTAYLQLDDASLQAPDPTLPLSAICLGRTAVTSVGLARIAPQSQLTWLDLSHLPVDASVVQRLLGDARQLQQLNLEATAVDDSLADLLQSAQQLREVDLSFTGVTDACLQRLAHHASLETLWLTGTSVTDATLRQLIDRYSALQAVDLQQTAVTAAALAQLKQARPQLSVNPLTLLDASSQPSHDGTP